MKNFLFLLFFLTHNSAYAKNQALENEILKIIKKTGHETANLGLLIEDEKGIVFELNSTKLFTPASLTKMITAGALLKNFPMNTKFLTSLKSNAKIENGILNGDLCFLGGGDPSFVSEKMWFLVNELTRSNFRHVKGDLIIDSSLFDNENFDSGRDSVRVDRAYDAPISAVSFNWNSVNVFIRPTKKGEAAQVVLDPVSDYAELVNNTKTVNGKVNSLAVTRETGPKGDRIRVSGNIGDETNEVVFYKSISNPEAWVGSHLIRFLKDRGIEVTGKVKNGVCASDSTLLASVQSKNFNEMLSDMLKFSNNFVAEMLIKNLAAMNGSKPAKMSDGIEIALKYLDSIGLKRDQYTLVNMSGLTRENRLSAMQINSVAKSIEDNFFVAPEFLSGLPIAGMDGTMKSRFKNMENPPIVRAKTGYLDGVVGLSGFLEQKGKKPYVFTFIYNGGYEKALAARGLFDQIISALNKSQSK